MLLASVQAMELSLSHAPPVNLGSVHGRKLETLAVAASRLSGVRALEARGLRVLILGTLDTLDEVVELLEANAPTLEVLQLNVSQPFPPERLPALPQLQRLAVPSYEALRDS